MCFFLCFVLFIFFYFLPIVIAHAYERRNTNVYVLRVGHARTRRVHAKRHTTRAHVFTRRVKIKEKKSGETRTERKMRENTEKNATKEARRDSARARPPRG